METKVTHMNAGDGEKSYANNSNLQKFVISTTLPILDDALREMFASDVFQTTTCFRIVDLGCSSGPNTISVMSYIFNKIKDLYHKGDDSDPLEFEVFLNDLPSNDFNNLFKLLSSFNKSQHNTTCSWYGLPGSFYDSLFPRTSIHFGFSCYSLHWLSQVPDGVEKNNKENISVATTTPQEVFEAYAKQYRRDFSAFLSMRSKEIISGGRMVLVMIGRQYEDRTTRKDDGAQLPFLEKALQDMAVEGLIKMDDLHSFNVPLYFACEKEVERVIDDEGSFNLHALRSIPTHWDACNDEDVRKSGKLVADSARAYMEPILTSHFGGSIINEVFERYAEHAAKYMSMKKIEYWNIAISLCRK